MTRGFRTTLALLLFALMLTSPAVAEGRRSSMVIDANTGEVLYASAPDAPRYPASLTKMMTLYLLFEEIERGRLGLGHRIKFSERAAAAAPSKLGLQAGEEIEIADAIKALIVKSANDVAIAVAEHIAGSEAAFARLMTEKSRLIGMSNTTFRNASGLPDLGQVTTARDMLTLAMRLQDDFPKYYPYFATQNFTYNGQTYRNHNTLLGTLPGIDGLKTGYIRMSGFNMVASVKRGGRHIVAAVFGGASAASRNAEMRALLARALPKASTVRTRRPVPVQTARATPPQRADRGGAAAQAVRMVPQSATRNGGALPGPADDEPASPGSAAPSVDIAIARVRTVQLGAASASRPETSLPAAAEREMQQPQLVAAPQPARGLAPSTLQQQAANLARGEPPLVRSVAVPQPTGRPGRLHQPVTGAPASPPAAPNSAGIAATGSYHVQVGAYASASEAEKALTAALKRAAGLLGNAAPLTTPVQRGSQQLYRARFGGFDQQAAASVCLELRRRQIDCFVARAE
jgi:D-alanyl-D-alanine carboxypeptidase